VHLPFSLLHFLFYILSALIILTRVICVPFSLLHFPFYILSTLIILTRVICVPFSLLHFPFYTLSTLIILTRVICVPFSLLHFPSHMFPFPFHPRLSYLSASSAFHLHPTPLLHNHFYMLKHRRILPINISYCFFHYLLLRIYNIRCRY
jgi:hypothetical protein